MMSLGLMVVALAVSAGPADEGRARALFDAGAVAYGRGQYGAALRAFESAYALAPRPGIAFSLAQALRRRFTVDGDPDKLDRAIALFSSYLRDHPEARRREDASDQLQALLAIRAGLDARAPSPPPAPPATELLVYSRVPGARITVDGSPLAAADGVLAVRPGVHTVVARADGFAPRSLEVTAVEGRLVPVELALRPLPAQVSLRTEDGAVLTVDGERARTTPLVGPLELAPGTHTLTLEASGRVPWSEPVTLGRGEARTLAVELAPTPRRRAAGWTLGGAAGLAVAGLGTTALAVYFEGRAQDVAGAPMNVTAAALDGARRDRDRRDALRASSAALLGTALVAGTVGAILYLAE